MSATETRVEPPQTAAFTVTLDDEPGALARLVSLISARGLNIKSLCVAIDDTTDHCGRLTVVLDKLDIAPDLITAQFGRLVPVREARVIDHGIPHVARELALAHLAGGKAALDRLKDQLEARGGRLLITTSSGVVCEHRGSAEEIDRWLNGLKPLGLLRFERTGEIALATESVEAAP